MSILVLVLTAAACSRPEEERSASRGSGTANAPAPPSTPSDSEAPHGSSAPLLAQAGRIVSLAPNLTEILFALGLGDRVVGVTDFCNYPPEALALPKVGGFVNPSAEAILALRPDLVVATPNVGNRTFVERVIATGARVEVVQARNVAEIVPAIASIARAAGVPERGARLAAELQEAIDRQTARVAGLPRPRVLFCIQIEPLIAAGPGSYPGDLLELAGGKNIAPPEAGHYPTLSMEAVLVAAPEAIVQSLMDTKDGATGAESLQGYWRRFPSIPAVAQGRVTTVPGDPVLRPGPRAPEGIAALIAILHPRAPAANAQGREAPGVAAERRPNRASAAALVEPGW